MVPLCSTLKLPNESFLAPKHTLSLFILNQGAAEKKKKTVKKKKENYCHIKCFNQKKNVE